MARRPFRADDRDACLALFDGNTPTFFAPSEREGFAAFLDAPNGPYLVIEREGRVLACGGWRARGDVGTVVWTLVARDAQGGGVGRALIEPLLDALQHEPGLRLWRLETTPLVAPFFARYGFVETGRIVNGYAPGLDQVEMVRPPR